MAVVFDEVLGSVQSPDRGDGNPQSPAAASGDSAPPERDAANFIRTRTTMRLIEQRQIRLRAT